MKTFTIEIIGDTEVAYNNLDSSRKALLRDRMQVNISGEIMALTADQEAETVVTNDVSITES